jgi:EAL and modified HD-GYP domain-containing signal transduction protein
MLYVGRQPILDSQRRLAGHELLYRSSNGNWCPPDDPDLLCKRTMDTAVLFGLDTLSSGHKLFLNCTHDVIVGGFPTLFPSESTVIEILETVIPTATLVSACRELKEKGYGIALDDFVYSAQFDPLIEIADYIKVDVRLTTLEECEALARNFLAGSRCMLAEKVESEEEFHNLNAMGFSLFQGYFFSRPKVLSTSRIDGFEPQQLRIFELLSRPQLNVVDLESVIKAEPALCFRLLRYLNSPVFCLQSEVRSILQGLLLLGETAVRKWLMLVCSVISGARPQKRLILQTALVRARFAEMMAPYFGVESSALFIAGLMSMMDAIMDKPLPIILEQVAISEDIRQALLGHENGIKKCLNLVVAYEATDWNLCEKLRPAQVSSEQLSATYMNAVQRANEFADLP